MHMAMIQEIGFHAAIVEQQQLTSTISHSEVREDQMMQTTLLPFAEGVTIRLMPVRNLMSH